MNAALGRLLQLIGMIVLPIGLMYGLMRDEIKLEVRLLAVGGFLFVLDFRHGRGIASAKPTCQRSTRPGRGAFYEACAETEAAACRGRVGRAARRGLRRAVHLPGSRQEVGGVVGRASGGEQARHEEGASTFPEQGALFPDDRPLPDADAGILVPPGDVGALRAALREVVDGTRLAEARGPLPLKTMDAHAAELEALYRGDSPGE